MKVKRFTHVLVLVLFIGGCAANPEKIQQVAGEEANRLQPPPEPLSIFSDYELKPMAFAPEIEQEEEKLEAGRQLEGKVRERVMPLLKEWRNDDTAAIHGTLAIEPELAGLRIISEGTRFLAGAWAGDSFIDLDLRLVDQMSGEQVQQVRIRRDSDAMAGAWSMGKSDQNLDQYISEIIYEYLASNYEAVN